MTLEAKIFAIYETVKNNALKNGFTLTSTENKVILTKGEQNLGFDTLEEVHSFNTGYDAKVAEAQAEAVLLDNPKQDDSVVNTPAPEDHPSDYHD